MDGELVYRNAKGQAESVRYEMVNAMLLNEFLKEHEHDSKIQSVSNRLERSDAAARMVVNSQ